MMNITKSFALPGLFLLAAFTADTHAATLAANSCSVSDVQTAINSSVTGDTVTIPAGSCTWTSGVTISGKAIIVTGQGSGRIVSYSSDTLSIGTGSKTINIQSGLAITAGQTLRISQTGQRSNWMQGTVASYSGSVLTMNITSVGGSGSSRRWLISSMPLTTIVNNSSSTLFSLVESTAGNINVSGIKVAQGSGGGDVFQFNRTASGGRAILLHDCWIEQGSGDSIWSDSNRGVIWNCSFDASPFSSSSLAFHHQSGVNTSWTTRSTMGTADTTGENNVYIENSDFHAYNNATDFDSNSRVVIRYNLFNHAGVGTHGADTSTFGQRHFEYYNNTGVFNGYSDGTTFGQNWWIYIRGGTFVVANNVLPRINSQDYPNKPDLNVTVMNLQRSGGPNPCWGAGTTNGARYPSPRQEGLGNVTGTGVDVLGRSSDSITYVGDNEPGYIWGNSRPGGSPAPLVFGLSDYGGCTNPDSTQNYVVSGRDYFNTTGTAKPGWAPYPYPHPLTAGSPAAIPAPPIDTTSPSVPANPSATAASSSLINLSWAASTDNIGVTGYKVDRCQGSSCSNFTQIATPSGTSYSDSGVAANTTYRYRVAAADSAGNWSGYSTIASATTSAVSGPTPLPSGNNGISALFPGDSNIRSHRDVIFADDFESYTSVSSLSANWNQIYQQQYTRIATEPANVFSGNRALEFRVPQQSSEVSNAVIRNLSPAEDTVFLRVYTKFETGYNAVGSSHSGIALKAQYCCAGVPANGTNKFYVDLENSRDSSGSEPSPGFAKIYTYHPEQRSEWGDLWYPDGRVIPFDSIPGDFGPNFVPRPNFTPQLNRWYSYELMVKANTPGLRDGRIAIWIDGNLIADFLNVRLRDVASLKMDVAELGLHIGSNTLRQNLKWYDNVVIARSYIGPMSPSGPAPVVPPTNLSAIVQ